MNAIVEDPTHELKYKQLQEMYPDLLFLEDAAKHISQTLGRTIPRSYLQQICAPSGYNLGEIKKHPSGVFKKMLDASDVAIATKIFQEGLDKKKSAKRSPAFPPPQVQFARGCMERLRQMPKFSATEAAKELGQDVTDIAEIVHDEVVYGRLECLGPNAHGHQIYRWKLVDAAEASLGRIKVSLNEQVEREFYALSQQVKDAQEKVKNGEDLLIASSSEIALLKEELALAKSAAQGQKEMRQGIEMALKDSLRTIAAHEELIVALNSEKIRMQEEVELAKNQERWANSSFLTAEAALKKAKDKVKELHQTLMTGNFTCVNCEVANR